MICCSGGIGIIRWNVIVFILIIIAIVVAATRHIIYIE